MKAGGPGAGLNAVEVLEWLVALEVDRIYPMRLRLKCELRDNSGLRALLTDIHKRFFQCPAI